MAVKRMDNVGIVLEDMEGTVDSFRELGLELECQATIEGEWAGRVTGLGNQHVEIAMMRTPDGHSRLELSRFLKPPVVADHRNSPVNALGYLLHIIRSMKSTGKAACILPHGVLFRGNAEAVIRENLVRSGYLKGIIGLPANLFYGTGIPACILVLDKENAVGRKGIFMIDASKGYMKDGPKNRLREQDIHKIVDTFIKGADVPRYARWLSIDEIADPKNAFNLNLPRYIDATDPEDLQDI
jgi:type I restriction-modification system DNA methylase subunit